MSRVVIAETVRRHFSSLGYIVFLLFMGMVGIFAASFATPASMWPSLVALLAIITGSAIVGPELSSGALQLIVSKPIRRPVYLLSRVAGVFVSVAAAAAAALIAEVGVRLTHTEAVPWSALMERLGGALAASLLVIAMLTLLGSLTSGYLNAAIYLGTQFAMSIMVAIGGMLRLKRAGIGQLLRDNPGIERGLTKIDELLFASVPNELTLPWLGQTGVTILIALVLACLLFERREVPYGVD